MACVACQDEKILLQPLGGTFSKMSDSAGEGQYRHVYVPGC